MKLKNILRYFSDKIVRQQRYVAELIGEYYLLKNNNDYTKTQEELRNLGVHEIKTFMHTITITLMRPGLLIGRRGENIENLQKYIFSKTDYNKLDIKEDKVLWYMMPQDYSDEYEVDI